MAALSSKDHQSEQTQLMPSPGPYTLTLDQDVCVTCDGECTCNLTSDTRPSLPIAAPSADASRSSAAAISASASSAAPPPGTLKIKLTLPPRLLSRTKARRSPSRSSSVSLTPAAKKRSRSANHASPANSHVPTRRIRPSARSLSRLPANTKKNKKPTDQKPTRARLASAARRQAPQLVDADNDDAADVDSDSDDNDASHQRAHMSFPTFLPAPAHVLSSASSSSSESSSSSSDGSQSDSDASSDADSHSSLSDFSDSSIAREEESFIQTEEVHRRSHAHDRARVRRELLGDDVPTSTRRSAWEIRPRQRSVGASADEMAVEDGDDDDEDEDEDEDEGGAADEEDDADGNGDEDGEDENAEERARAQRSTYVGIATGWSDDDDDEGFDAELFFAGLEESDSGAEPNMIIDEDDGYASEDETEYGDDTLHLASRGIFEVTEGWDGSIIFTNGLRDGQGLLDWDFEANARLLSTSSGDESEGEQADIEDDVHMDGYESDDPEDEMDTDAGHSTDDELVDERGLPTERLMRLFRPPVLPPVSIDPQSTLSPLRPHVSFWDQADEQNERARSSPKKRRPSMGMFETAKGDALRRAVVDGSRKLADLPSPFPPRHKRGLSDSSSIQTGRNRSLSLSQSVVFSPSSCASGLPIPSSEVSVSPELSLAEPITLDDVLDASLIDSDPFDDASQAAGPPDTDFSCTSDAAASSSARHMQILARWDRVPISTFRQTRESGLMSDPSASPYADRGVLRSSPFSALAQQHQRQQQQQLHQDGLLQGPAHSPHTRVSLLSMDSPSSSRKATRRARRATLESAFLSPVILPVRDRDGERTPSPSQHPYTLEQQQRQQRDKLSRRADRRDKMHERKNMLGTAPPRRAQRRQHLHGHHPNAKGRASGSVQRAFSGSVPPLSL